MLYWKEFNIGQYTLSEKTLPFPESYMGSVENYFGICLRVHIIEIKNNKLQRNVQWTAEKSFAESLRVWWQSGCLEFLFILEFTFASCKIKQSFGLNARM